MVADHLAFVDRCRARHADLLEGGEVIFARAPGRLDLYGGIIDYTGGTVCELPLAVAAHVALRPRDDRRLIIRSEGAAEHGLRGQIELTLDDLLTDAGARPYDDVRQRLGADPDAAWARYIAGAWVVLVAEGLVPAIDRGANVVVASEIPLGAGVSSSAALEMATLNALADALGLTIDGQRLARLGQLVENRVVGAPCGLMDQLTSQLGRADATLVLRCQPDEVLGTPALPACVRVAALNTGVKHSVGGGEYTATRCAAFMGHRIILDHLHRSGWSQADPFDGYLARVPPREFGLVYQRLLPASLTGAEFAARYGDTVDEATRPEPERAYHVAAATTHHVEENARSLELLALLEQLRETGDRALLPRAGELLLASHSSYRDNCLMGADEADLVVELVLAKGPAAGLYGAKITGGGCGGSVAILGDERLPEHLPEIAAAYAARTGITPDVLTGSSDGAGAFGARRLTL